MCSTVNAKLAEINAPGNEMRYLIVRGNGRAFCSGADIKSFYQVYADNKNVHPSPGLSRKTRTKHWFPKLVFLLRVLRNLYVFHQK